MHRDLDLLEGTQQTLKPSVRRMGEVVYVSRNVPMIKSVMRSIIVIAARTPSIVMRKIQKWHSSVPGGVKEVQKRRERDNEQHRL